MTFRRPDRREIPPEELPTERAIRNRGTVRAEEMVIHRPDGRAVNTVVNATPILSEDGEVLSVVATIQDLTPLEEKQRWEFLGNERGVENALDSDGDAVANRRLPDCSLDRPALTGREREVLRLVAQGLDNRSIADRLFISSHTVLNHIRNVCRKLKARNKLEAVLTAMRLDLL